MMTSRRRSHVDCTRLILLLLKELFKNSTNYMKSELIILHSSRVGHVFYLSLDDNICLSVFVRVSQGNTENFRHFTDS